MLGRIVVIQILHFLEEQSQCSAGAQPAAIGWFCTHRAAAERSEWRVRCSHFWLISGVETRRISAGLLFGPVNRNQAHFSLPFKLHILLELWLANWA